MSTRSPRRHLILIVLCTALAAGTVPALAGPDLIFEDRLNDSSQLILENGASIGNDGSGVSGQPSDRSLVGEAGDLQPGGQGPYASITVEAGVYPANLEALTVTAWYKPTSDIRHDSVLFNGFGTMLIWDQKAQQWVLRLEPTERDEKPSMFWFFSGTEAAWSVPGEWTFIAMVWRKDAPMQFLKGAPAVSVQVAREMRREEPVESISETQNVKRSLGGSAQTPDRAFDGSIDNVRLFARALEEAEIEKIRQADVNNEPIVP